MYRLSWNTNGFGKLNVQQKLYINTTLSWSWFYNHSQNFRKPDFSLFIYFLPPSFPFSFFTSFFISFLIHNFEELPEYKDLVNYFFNFLFFFANS